MPAGDQIAADPLLSALDGAPAGPGLRSGPGLRRGPARGSGPGDGLGELSDAELAAHVSGLARRRTVAAVEPGRSLVGRDLLTALREADRRYPLVP